MKKLLIASTALVATAGVAAADVSVGGDGRMGLVYDSDSGDTKLSSRLRISFSASGETDRGLSFGGSVRSDNSPDGTSGNAGSVFLSGAFGKISMGDVDGASKAAVGQVSGVGYTGIGDRNEILFLNAGNDIDGDGTNDTLYPNPSALYEYTAGSTTFYAGIGQIGGDLTVSDAGDAGAAQGQSYSLGVKWANDNGLTLSAGYEATQDLTFGADDGTGTIVTAPVGDISQFALGADWTNGTWTAKGRYAKGDFGTLGDVDQYAVSLDWTSGATTLTGFYRVSDLKNTGKLTGYGLGAAYDLGGGATFAAGWSRLENRAGDNVDRADAGIKFSF